MMRRALRVLGPQFAFAVLSAQSCGLDLEGLVNKPGVIVVTNASTHQAAVIALIADDVKSYPTLAPGQSAQIKTNVGGRYEVRVVMTPENAIEYRADLLSLRRLVERQLDGTADVGEKTRLFADLAGIKSAIHALESGNAAGCSGTIKLKQDEEETVRATVTWQSTSGSGFWDGTCGSS